MLHQVIALSGWGKFPVETCHLYRPERTAEIARLFESGAESTFISRGLGRSYGDAALNAEAGVISHLRLNRMISFEDSTGVLECEAGVSFDEIIRTFLPRGFFPMVTPGTKFVTVGGAIANDVHGKNHHRDGTFAADLIEFTLATPARGLLVCSREKEPELFWATIGGLGLTGALITAKFRLRQVESAFVRAAVHRTIDLDETLRLFAELDGKYTYSVAWVDSLARGRSLGRSVVMFAEHAAPAELPQGVRGCFEQRSARIAGVPFDLPSKLLNEYSIRAFNEAYYRSHASGEWVLSIDKFFYPLDAVAHWNRLYGKPGFVQYQVVLPDEGGEAGVRVLMERLSSSKRPSFLAVLKRFGDQNQGMLSFPRRGYTLAVDLPAGQETAKLLGEMDEIVIRYGGRVYLGKDALLGCGHFRQMYSRAAEFESIKSQVDPEGLISSSLSRRLGIFSPAESGRVQKR